MESSEECVICKKTLIDTDDQQTLKKKGAESLVADGVPCKPGDIVHYDCRKTFTRNKSNAARKSDLLCESPEVHQTFKRCLRKDSTEFDFQTNCFLCGKEAHIDIASRDHHQAICDIDVVIIVRTLIVQDMLTTTGLSRYVHNHVLFIIF